MIDTALFDMDGTILDTIKDLDTSVNYALERAGLPGVTEAQTRFAAGYGARVLMEMLSEGAFEDNPEAFASLLGDFRAHYAEHSQDQTGPYEGVMECLAGLKERGIKMAVVSNKVHPDTEALRQIFFGDYIDLAIGLSDEVPAKPDPGMAYAALEKLGSAPENAIFVGDSEPDVQTGVNAGCTSVAVLWGFRSREVLEQENPDFFAEHPLDIVRIVDELNAA